MNEISYWEEVVKGLYKYVSDENVCYEILILYHQNDTNILTAKASLFVTGKESFFERICLLSEQPVFECIGTAIRDIRD